MSKKINMGMDYVNESGTLKRHGWNVFHTHMNAICMFTPSSETQAELVESTDSPYSTVTWGAERREQLA